MGFHARLFYSYMKRLKEASENPQQAAIDSDEIIRWRNTWANAYDDQFVPGADILDFGTELGRIAERHSQHILAEEALERLANSAANGEPWITNPASLLITAGEYNRRRSNLDLAASRFEEAGDLLLRGLANADSNDAIHRDLGRVFYELGYLERLRGDAGASRSAFERSEAECDLANDGVGAEIARTILALISVEEGQWETALRELTECLSRLKQLAHDPEVEKAGRRGLVLRWVGNAHYHLIQAHLACGDTKIARRLIREAERWRGPSITGLVTAKRIEAQLSLREGNLESASEAVSASWKAIDQQGDLMSTELAAATVALAGVIRALEGGSESALLLFEQACGLPADLHNRRAQGLAWGGRAILAREAGDRAAFLAAVQGGLTAVRRCGTPIRAFLLDFLRDSYKSQGLPNLDDLKRLMCSS